MQRGDQWNFMMKDELQRLWEVDWKERKKKKEQKEGGWGYWNKQKWKREASEDGAKRGEAQEVQSSRVGVAPGPRRGVKAVREVM